MVSLATDHRQRTVCWHHFGVPLRYRWRWIHAAFETVFSRISDVQLTRLTQGSLQQGGQCARLRDGRPFEWTSFNTMAANTSTRRLIFVRPCWRQETKPCTSVQRIPQPRPSVASPSGFRVKCGDGNNYISGMES